MQCSTPNCPYSTKLIRGLCRNCYGWTQRWTHASAAHWNKFRSAFELRTERMKGFTRREKRAKKAA